MFLVPPTDNNWRLDDGMLFPYTYPSARTGSGLHVCRWYSRQADFRFGRFAFLGSTTMTSKATGRRPATRKRVSKGVRFEIFKRDGFTCQYCGAMPPDTVLHVDHILAIVEGGGHDDDNLITACEACNIGKGRKILDRPQKPDADLAWLEAQQEVAELRRYQEAKAERDGIKAEVVATLQETWGDYSGLDWMPSDHIIFNLLEKYPPEWIEEALIVLAPKVASGYVKKAGGEWVKYLHGILRNRDAAEMEALGLAS